MGGRAPWVVLTIRLCKYVGMDVTRRDDDPLAQPTRARLFGQLAALRRPADTVDLADRLELHPNGVRIHLERLRRAGLVERRRVRGGRGRPRDMWTVAAGALPSGDPPTAYADLSRWLARAMAAGGDLEAAGREIGRELAAPGPADHRGDTHLDGALAAMGFRPERHDTGPGAATYRLCNCPYRDAARAAPEVVCTLHRGLTRGLLERLDPSSHLTAFVPDDPDRAGCRIDVAGPDPAA